MVFRKTVTMLLLLNIVVFAFTAANAACPSCDSSNGHKSVYSSSNAHIENPGRGFVTELVTYFSHYDRLTVSQLDYQRQKTGINMVWRTFVMDTAVTSHITDNDLNKIRDDLFIVKDAGWTAVLRFCYVFGKTPAHAPYGDANKHWILEHIKQLRPVFDEFEGIITTVQAGFIGNWGEWYYTTYFGDPKHKDYERYPDGFSPRVWQDRKDVLTALLDAVPKSLQVQVRYPALKMTIWNTNTPTTFTEVSRHTHAGRTAHHNDCFLSSDNDVGTYSNPSVERPYLHEDTKFLIVGGETCALTKNHRHECPTALAEMKTFHWTFLNEYFYEPMYAVWKQQGCYEEVHRRLGYRLRLTEATIPHSVHTGSDMCVKLVFRNDGFAAPVKHMNVMLVLKAQNSHMYSVKLTSADVRLWLPGPDHTVTESIHIPSSFHQGGYHVYLAIGDPVVTDNADYFVLLANANVPEFSTGLNDLHRTLTVSGHRSATSTCGHLKGWSPPHHGRYSRVFTGKLNN